MIKKLIKYILVLVIASTCLFACKSNSYPCPGNGTANARDLSLFDEEGNLKSEKNKKKKKGDNGLVKKKQDDRLKNRRKAYLGDKPKNLKK